MPQYSSFVSPQLRGQKTAKIALIAEGGGQRGIFTAGVLDAWLEDGFDPFDILIGTLVASKTKPPSRWLLMF